MRALKIFGFVISLVSMFWALLALTSYVLWAVGEASGSIAIAMASASLVVYGGALAIDRIAKRMSGVSDYWRRLMHTGRSVHGARELFESK